MKVLVSLSLMYHRLLGECKGTRIKYCTLSCLGKLLIFFFFSFLFFFWVIIFVSFAFQVEFGMSSFLKVDISLVIDDGKNANQKVFFNLREIEDDLESLYQTRAKEWFPFSLTMKVPGLDPHQTVQVGNAVLN